MIVCWQVTICSFQEVLVYVLHLFMHGRQQWYVTRQSLAMQVFMCAWIIMNYRYIGR